MVLSLEENHYYGSEDEMVKLFMKKFKDSRTKVGEDFPKPLMFEQITIRDIRRRSDLIMMYSEKRLVNIEFKLHDIGGVIKQAMDHKRWCDYSCICIPGGIMNTYPHHTIVQLMKLGIGLILYINGSFVEILRAAHNPYTKGKNKQIRNQVLRQLQDKIIRSEN